MKRPVKTFFIALPVLVVGAVFWHLQHPSQVIPGEDPCPPSATQATAPASTQGTGTASVAQAMTGACAVAGADAPNHGAETRITAIRLVQLDGDRIQWTLNAPSAQEEEEEHILIREPNLTIDAPDGQRSSITSTAGFVDGHSQAMLFTGHVVANQGAQRLTTEILRFDPKEQTLYTDQPFLLVNQEMRLEGIGLTLYQETQKMTVQQRVRVHYFTTQDEVCREKSGFQS
ncbi:MAG: LPS export ABC transporter periplasmic protein LptC [Magnetococcales bacterium]|nr:LPS export ABC transporter periplasmic protein LptC [Magnetococcales bacterium]